MESSKCAIVNVAIGSWYPRGQKRLKESLIYHGFAGDFFGFTEFPIGDYDTTNIYNAKAAAIENVVNMGYETVLWLDCSVWAISNPSKIFDMINDEGVLMLTSGYNASQTCSDKCLNYFGVSRDSAEAMPDASTGCFGFNVSHPTGMEFYERWIKAAKDGAFYGSREHDNQSSDNRFLFHRQDQSAASVICGLMGIKMHNYGEYAMYYHPKMNKEIIFVLRGL